MKKIIIKIGLLILFFILSVGMIANIIIIKKDILPDRKTQIEITSTVKQIIYNDELLIYTNEYLYPFSIKPDIMSEKNLNLAKSLNKEEKIYCTLNSATRTPPISCRIFSLKTDNTELLSTNEYLNYAEQEFIGLAVTGCSVSVFFFMIDVILLISIIKNYKQLRFLGKNIKS